MTLGKAIDHVLRRVDELGIAQEPECYAVSEAVYRLAGGKKAGLRAMQLGSGPRSHWFLMGPRGEVIDLTAGQFDELQDYYGAKRRSFYPTPSKLTKELMR